MTRETRCIELERRREEKKERRKVKGKVKLDKSMKNLKSVVLRILKFYHFKQLYFFL